MRALPTTARHELLDQLHYELKEVRPTCTPHAARRTPHTAHRTPHLMLHAARCTLHPNALHCELHEAPFAPPAPARTRPHPPAPTPSRPPQTPPAWAERQGERLPPALADAADRLWRRAPHEQAAAAVLGLATRRALGRIVLRASATQSLKGILTAGGARALQYLGEKVGKRFK